MKDKHLIQRCLKYWKRLKPSGMQTMIMVVFSAISVSIMLILGVVMYFRFSATSQQEMIQATQKLMEQTGENMEDYLMNMRQVSDAAYYNVIKENDFSEHGNDIQQGLSLLDRKSVV